MAPERSRLNLLLRYASSLLAACWAGLIYYLSDQPSLDIQPLFQHQDKVMHLCAYFILGLLIMGTMRRASHGYSVQQFQIATLLTGFYGVVDEYHQSFVPGRDSSVADAIADITGATLGAGLLFLLVRRYLHRPGDSLQE